MKIMAIATALAFVASSAAAFDPEDLARRKAEIDAEIARYAGVVELQKLADEMAKYTVMPSKFVSGITMDAAMICLLGVNIAGPSVGRSETASLGCAGRKLSPDAWADLARRVREAILGAMEDEVNRIDAVVRRPIR